MRIDQIILLDDDSQGNVIEFVQRNGLSLLEREFEVESAVAVIGDARMHSLDLYQGVAKERSFQKPTADVFPEATAKEILKYINSEGKNILILCDREWVVDVYGNSLETALNQIVSVFEATYWMDKKKKKRYEHIIMIFYSTCYQPDVLIPNQRAEVVIIKQNEILDWNWDDIYSSIYRAKLLLMADGLCEFPKEEGGER